MLRAACVRAFLGGPRLVFLEMPLSIQEDGLMAALLAAGAQARGNNACVVWLAANGPALRDRSIDPTHMLRLSDTGLGLGRRGRIAA